jgi:glycerophosphoryl diester phosphodiesterase
MISFQQALECKADVIEFDVHLSRDGRCVVIHDDTLDRTTDGHGSVRDYSWEELSKLDAGNWFDKKNQAAREQMKNKEGRYADPNYIPPPLSELSYAGVRIPCLEEVLEWAVAEGMPTSIEIKAPFPFYGGIEVYPNLIEKILDLVAKYGHEEKTQMHSFDHKAVLRVKELNPNISTAISTYGAVLVDPLNEVQAARADGIAVGSLWVTQELIDLYHADNRNVFAWGWGEDPLNEEKELGRLVKMGVDYVSGGYPDILRQVVEKYL